MIPVPHRVRMIYKYRLWNASERTKERTFNVLYDREQKRLTEF